MATHPGKSAVARGEAKGNRAPRAELSRACTDREETSGSWTNPLVRLHALPPVCIGEVFVDHSSFIVYCLARKAKAVKENGRPCNAKNSSAFFSLWRCSQR